MVGNIADRFSGCSEQDTQEFLTYLLQGLHEEVLICNTPRKKSKEIESLPCGQLQKEMLSEEVCNQRYVI